MTLRGWSVLNSDAMDFGRWFWGDTYIFQSSTDDALYRYTNKNAMVNLNEGFNDREKFNV